MKSILTTKRKSHLCLFSPSIIGGIRKLMLLMLLAFIAITVAYPQSTKKVWYAQAGATGDGTRAQRPLGSTAEVETTTKAGDIIMLLPSDAPLDGGLTLKDGQALIGLPEAERKPMITNTDSTKNGGVGILLAQNNRIWNVRIENTWASGILGTNVSGTSVEEVEVMGANQSGAYTEAEMKVLGPLPQGGIVFVATSTDGSGVNRVIQSEVSDARGFGIASFAFGGAKCRLSVSYSQIEGGTPVARFDWGITTFANGSSSEINLDVTETRVNDRLSKGGRNVVVLASSDAYVNARIEGSHLGEAGQDGVLAVASMIPAQVDLEIRECIVEKAGWTNIEGTILNLPPSDSLRAHETRVSVEVVGSTIREAGGENGFEGEKPENITMASSAMAQQMNPNSKSPFPPGTYQLTVQNNRLEGEGGYDVVIGNPGVRFVLPPEQSTFEVVMRENMISDSGEAEFLIAAPKASIDARKNCWGTSEGLSKERVLLKQTAELSQLDVSEPSSCAEVESN